jgi:hypothetical protein
MKVKEEAKREAQHRANNSLEKGYGPAGLTPIKFFKSQANNEIDAVLNIPKGKESDRSKGDLFKEKLNEIVGVEDSDLALSILEAAGSAVLPLVGSGENLNIVLQSLHDFSPKNAIEARLVAQSAVLYTYAMKSMKRAGEMDVLSQIESMTNLGIKLIRAHNETIEALSRYRRGGDQKVTVTHAVVAGQAVVNNFNGVGVPAQFKGETPCSEYAEPKQEQIAIDHAASQQWPTDAVGCMEEKAAGRRLKRAKDV